MATERWQTTFDLIGLAAYFTLMTGEVPDGKLLREARRETGRDGLSVFTIEDHQPRKDRPARERQVAP